MRRVPSPGFRMATGLLLVAATLAPIHAQIAVLPAEVSSVLSELGGFTADDLAALQAGQVIARSDTNPALLEASVVAAVGIASAKERTLAYYRTLISYIDGQVTTGYGVFSRPPSENDVKSLHLDRADLTDLESCVPGDCAIRLRAAAPDATPPAIEWGTADAAARATAWV